MGLLTTAQKTAIAAGAPMRRVYYILRPTSSGGDPNDPYIIHDDADPGRCRVVAHGTIANSAYNVSLMDAGEWEGMSVQIPVRNDDGFFHPWGSSNAYNDGVSGYQATPRECLLRRRVYVWSEGAWSELPGSPWNGRVLGVDYGGEVEAADGSIVYGTATIRAESYLNSELRKTWTLDHGTTSTITTSYTPSGFVIGNISYGMDYTSGQVRLWLQFSTSATCNSTTDYSFKKLATTPEYSGTSTVSSVTTHQHSWLTGTSGSLWNYTAKMAANVTPSAGGATIRIGYGDIPPFNWDGTYTARPW